MCRVSLPIPQSLDWASLKLGLYAQALHVGQGYSPVLGLGLIEAPQTADTRSLASPPIPQSLDWASLKPRSASDCGDVQCVYSPVLGLGLIEAM